MSDNTKELQHSEGMLVALASVVILSTTGVIIRHLNLEYGMPPVVMAFWRNLFLVTFLGFYLELFYPRLVATELKNIPYLIFYGLLLAVFNVLWAHSVAFNGAGVATVLVCLSSIFTLILGRLFLKEEFTWIKVVVTIVAFVGTLFVADVLHPANWQGNVVGVLCGVMTGLCWATYNLLGRSASNRGINPWTTLFYAFGFATDFIAVLIVIGKKYSSQPELYEFFYLGWDWTGWGYVLLLALVATLLGFGLCNVALSLVPASTVNLVLISEPVMTMIWAYYLLGEVLNRGQLIGSSIIVSALLFYYLSEIPISQKWVGMKRQRFKSSIT